MKRVARRNIDNQPLPAAFRRLCVETKLPLRALKKPASQPPSGGCVLKLFVFLDRLSIYVQPPSGGCVLKPAQTDNLTMLAVPAAFRRLCVETKHIKENQKDFIPAAFRRLCVETIILCQLCPLPLPAAFRRLCVETGQLTRHETHFAPSRLQAAVC